MHSLRARRGRRSAPAHWLYQRRCRPPREHAAYRRGELGFGEPPDAVNSPRIEGIGDNLEPAGDGGSPASAVEPWPVGAPGMRHGALVGLAHLGGVFGEKARFVAGRQRHSQAARRAAISAASRRRSMHRPAASMRTMSPSRASAEVPTVNVSATALRFFFKVTLKRHDLAEEFVSTREPRRLPVVLSPEEVGRLLASAINIKHRRCSAWLMPPACEPRRSYPSSSPISIVTGWSSGSNRARAKRIGMSFSHPSFSRFARMVARCAKKGWDVSQSRIRSPP